jgi:hypothetical protein
MSGWGRVCLPPGRVAQQFLRKWGGANFIFHYVLNSDLTQATKAYAKDPGVIG